MVKKGQADKPDGLGVHDGLGVAGEPCKPDQSCKEGGIIY